MGGKVTKKDQPSPSQWTIIKCQNWLESSPITDPSDVIFLRTELQLRLNVLTKAVEQKKSEDQKLLIHDDDGKNWCGNDPILRLIHTLDDTVIRRAYMTRHNISNSRIVLDNAKSVEKREETVWQMMARKWNDEKFTPMTMALSPKLCTQYEKSWCITFDTCSDLSAATPEKCANKFSTMTVELQRMIQRWSLSGKGDDDLDEHKAGDDMDMFGSLGRCSQGALDNRANFIGISQPYILYLWEYFHEYDLLKTSFQRLDPKVASRNGGTGIPSIIRSRQTRSSPSDETLTLGTRTNESQDEISVSINLLGENNLRAALLESNSSEKNTLRNLIHNLRTQKRQLIVDRLKAMANFDEPMTQSLTEQIEEIDEEVKGHTTDLSVLSSDCTPPHKNPRTPKH